MSFRPVLSSIPSLALILPVLESKAHEAAWGSSAESLAGFLDGFFAVADRLSIAAEKDGYYPAAASDPITP